MFNKDIKLSEAIAILIHTAAASGGYYLIGFILTFLLTSPLSVLIGLFFVNIMSIIYFFSTLYAKIINYLSVRVEKCIEYVASKSWFKKFASFVSRTKAKVEDNKIYQWVKVTALLGYISIVGTVVKIKNFMVNVVTGVKNFVVNKYNTVKSWAKNLFTKSIKTEAKFADVEIVNTQVVA